MAQLIRCQRDTLEMYRAANPHPGVFRPSPQRGRRTCNCPLRWLPTGWVHAPELETGTGEPVASTRTLEEVVAFHDEHLSAVPHAPLLADWVPDFFRPEVREEQADDLELARRGLAIHRRNGTPRLFRILTDREVAVTIDSLSEMRKRLEAEGIDAPNVVSALAKIGGLMKPTTNGLRISPREVRHG